MNGIYNVVDCGSGRNAHPEYVKLSVVNTGMRDLIVVGIFWNTGWLRKKTFVQLPSTSSISTQLPKKISHGEEVTIMFPIDDFRVGAKPIAQVMKKSWIARRFPSYVKTGFYFSTGEQASRTLDETTRDLLLSLAAT